MKILFLIHQFYPKWHSGTEKITFGLASMMQYLGHSVKVLCFDDDANGAESSIHNRSFSSETVYKNLPIIQYRLRDYDGGIHTNLYYDINKELATLFHNIIFAENPDVVHVTHLMRGSTMAKVLINLGIPYIITLTDFFSICPKIVLLNSAGNLCSGPRQGRECQTSCSELSPGFIAERYSNSREILNNAVALFCPSEFVAQIYQTEFPDLRFNVINHGLDYRYIGLNDKQYDDSSNIVFGYIGTFSELKGLHILIDAFTNLHTDRSHLVLYGGIPNSYYAENIFKRIEGNSRIRLGGTFTSDQIGTVLSDIDIIVIPSICHETYSMVLHESMACGVPVIASDIGVFSSSIDNEYNGYKFEMGNVKSLQSVMSHLINAPSTLNTLKINLQRKEVPTIEQEAYLYERIFNTLLHPI